MVQQDFSSSFKTLGDISRETKLKRRTGFEEVFYSSAGLDILSRYEQGWFLLHQKNKDCAQLAESVDGDIVILSALWERRQAALTQLQEQLRGLPDLINGLDDVTANIAHLEGDFEEMEGKLDYLETLCCQCEQHTVEMHHMNELDAYKKKKMKEVESLEAELNCEHAQRLAELELAKQQKQRERQKVYEEAFHQDMEQYLSTGCLQHRETAGSDLCVLDEMTVANVSDQEALDDFLDSTPRDISAGSSLTSGADHESCSSESLTQVALADNHLSSQVGEWQEEEDDAELLIQSDEDDVQDDMSLVALKDAGTTWDYDESDSAGDLS